MAVVVGSATAYSASANTTSGSLITGNYEFIGKGVVTLVARGSATGMNAKLSVGGVTIIDDQPIPYTGTAGAISVNDHVMAKQKMNGGRVDFKLRNTTGGTLTTDYILYFEPM
jgi:hypothetical protein